MAILDKYPVFDPKRHSDDDRLSVWCLEDNLNWLYDLQQRLDPKALSNTVECEIVHRRRDKEIEYALFLCAKD